MHRAYEAREAALAAVGALHMIGPNSVPKLMEKMGYKIERVPFRTF